MLLELICLTDRFQASAKNIVDLVTIKTTVMKRTILLFAGLIVAMCLVAQSGSFQYQAVIRDNSGELLADQHVSVRVSILEKTITGTPVYTETHSDTSNPYGMIHLAIGEGNPVTGQFDTIRWGEADHFIRLEIDTGGGTNFESVGTSQLLSVPYALYAEETGRLGQRSTNYYGTSTIFISDSDTEFEAIPGLTRTIQVPENTSVLLSTTGSVYGTQWNAYSRIQVALFIDGEIPEVGGSQHLRIVTDDNVSSGGSNWSINYPVELEAGEHTVAVKVKNASSQTETNVTVDNSLDHSVLTVTFLSH